MSTASSRRPSHTSNVPTPAGPLHTSSGASMMASADSQIPIRHPRPLTAAELHLELEQEQEAVVNRLTRELSALRAQHSASVASNTSHSSSSSHQPTLLPTDNNDPTIVSSTHPTPSRQRRSSSNASSRSLGINTPSTSTSSVLSAAQREATASAALGGVSQASADRAAAAGGQLSRNPSVRSSSGQSTPARPSIDHSSSSHHSLALPHRPSISNAPSFISNAATVGSNGGGVTSPGVSYGPTSPHINPVQYYNDAATAKAELELVKEENENLRQRVRSLEQALRTKRRESQSQSQQSPYSEGGAPRERSLSRQSSQITHAPISGGVNITSWAAGTTVAGPRERSESQSTTASTRRAMTADDKEDNIRVGESAAGGGAGNARSGF